MDYLSTGIGMLWNNMQSNTAFGRQRHLMDIQQIKQQELNQQQFENQKRLNEQGAKMQMDMWRQTNYPAQVKMLKDAGLNPALLYGMKGGGGVTTGSQTVGTSQGGSATGGNAPLPNYMDIAQMASLNADIKLKEAQAKAFEADAAKTSGVDTDLAKATMLNVYEATKMITTQITTESMKQETIKLQNEIAEIDKESKNLSLKLDKETFDTKVRTLEASLENIKATNLKIIAETESTNIDNANKQKLIDQQVQLNNWSMVETQVRIAAARKGMELTDEQIWKLKEDVLQGWANVKTNKDALTTSEKNTEALANATIKSAWIVGGLSLGSNLAKLFIPMGAARTIVGGFGGK
jgi:hypothetical protein